MLLSEDRGATWGAPLYAGLRINQPLFDHSGRRALVIWSASWQGGTLRLEEKDGEWNVSGPVSFWVT